MKRALCLAVILLPGLGHWADAKDSYPSRPIRIVVPYPKGDGADRLVRLVAQRVASELAQPLYIENRPGISGILGVAQVSRASPDGYTIAYVNNITLSYAEVAHERLIYRPDELQPIVVLFSVADGIAVLSESPVRKLDELVSRARNEPGRITYTTPGRGASSNLSILMLSRARGLGWQYAPSSDSFQAARLLGAGGADVLVDNLTMLLPQARAGKVRVLAVTGVARSPLLPQVPTVAEAVGIGIGNHGWGGLVAPQGTPARVIDRLNEAVNAALMNPATIAALQAIGAAPVGGPPEQLKAMANQERAHWSDVSGPAR